MSDFYSALRKYSASEIIVGTVLASLLTWLGHQDKPQSQTPFIQPVKGRICLIIDDFGFSNNETIQGFLHLPRDFTCAVIPGQIWSSPVAMQADSLGFEVIVHMPMEPKGEVPDPDDGWMLLRNMGRDLVLTRILEAFRELPMAAGMNNHQGSAASEDLQLMKNVARTLNQLDKFYIDSYTSPDSRGFVTMRQYGVPTEVRQVFLDEQADSLFISTQLDSLVRLSETMSVAVGIGHARPVTLSVLQEALPMLKSQGYIFINASEAVR